MKLTDHVDVIRDLIYRAFDKQFSRLGIGANKTSDIDKLPQELHNKRQKLDQLLENHIGETGTYEDAREKALDELTFTLFNRIAAVKVMESASLFPPVITKQPEHGDRSFGHKAWLETRPDMRMDELEGIREYIKHSFNELGETLPLYSKNYPYAVLPDTISLNEIIDAFNEVEKDTQVGTDIWQSDDILGWLYESYNNAKKQAFKDSGEKTEYNKVSLQSQVYTPRWVVKFLVDNSLGKLYLEMYPDSKIKDTHKIANAPKTQERKPKPLNEVKHIDPACGSGNFLLYAFDLFYELYIDQIENYRADYDEDEIPRLIIENNLHGIDLDDRAVQLAQLGLYIKAKRKRRTTGTLHYNVISSDFFLPDYEKTRHIFEESANLDRNQKELIEDVWSDLKYAYKFGSLIRLSEKISIKMRGLLEQRNKEQKHLFTDKEMGIKQKEVQLNIFTEHDIEKENQFIATFFEKLEKAVEKHAQKDGNKFLTNKTQDAVTFLKLLTAKYDIATANPPYTDSSDFGPDLKTFIETNYKKTYKFNTNLYAAFIKRCYDFVNENGKISLIHPLTFMYIKTFEDVRKFMLNKTNIDLLVEFGLGGIFMTTKVDVDVVGYILTKRINNSTDDSFFMNLQKYKGLKVKQSIFEKAYNDYMSGDVNEHNYLIAQSKLKIIKSWPFIYWISDEFREKFEKESIDKFFKVSQGMSVSNGERFLRFNWELDQNDIYDGQDASFCKWAIFPKGGPFKKWTGNLWLCVNWKNKGAELKSFKKAVLRNQQYYFVEGLTYSSSGSKGATFRTLSNNAVISGGGPGIHQLSNKFSIYYCLGYLNSKFVAYVINCLNPTVNTTQGDLNRIPLIDTGSQSVQIIENCVKKCVEISTEIRSYAIIENNFMVSPVKFGEGNFKASLKSYLAYENYLHTLICLYQTIIDKQILDNVSLPDDDKAMVLVKEGESIGGLPVSKEAQDAYLADKEVTKEFLMDNIKDFIEALPIKEFTSEERGAVESEFSTLYRSNNDLEEFCIRHKVNPINVWYWFQQSNVIPKQRMNDLAMEFLADMIREILMEDEDGIIPLVPNAGEKVLIDRIQDKFHEKGFSSAQFSFFNSVLGCEMNDYLNNHFFKDLSYHLNLFRHLPMTPFIWHLTSGPEQGFDCYIIIYKWSRDNLFRLKSVYIELRERALINRQNDLANDNSAKAQNEKDKIHKQLNEIKEYKVKIDELLEEGYDPILDEGVGKNIAPLQKKNMIAYEVLNAGQLKKYLNADW